MIIIALECILISYLNRRIKSKGLDYSNKLSFALAFQLLILILYRIELLINHRVVYYSDAEVYWNNTIIILNGGSVKGVQLGYVWYCVLIQLTSPFRSVILINLSNMLLIDLAILFIAIIMQDSDVSANNIQEFIKISLFNPLIIYSLLRNLKDSLFVFIMVLIIYFYNKLKFESKTIFKLIYIFSILILTVYIATIRPWGFVIVLLLLADRLFIKEKRLRNIAILSVLLICGIVFIIVFGFYDTIKLWAPIVFESTKSQSIISIVSAPFRILTGPGPYRCLMGHKYFQFYTYVGNICSLVGCLMWWWSLLNYCFNIKKIQTNQLFINIGVILLAFLIIYSMQYGGSLELRFRGVIYILTSATFFSGLQEEEYNKTKTSLKVFMFVVLGAIITILSII